jgi:uncharacterized delta-60 repeat protein
MAIVDGAPTGGDSWRTGSIRLFALVSAMLLVLAAPATSSRTGASFDPSLASVDVGHSAVVQRDGKIVVAGISRRGHQSEFALARYRASGKLDFSFARGGLLLTDVGREASGLATLAEQVDGKLIVAGGVYVDVSGYRGAFAVSRYTRRGALDTTFGRGGTVLTAFRKPRPGKFSIAYVFGVALQPDGRIVVAGITTNVHVTRVALARYTRTGTLDPTFGKRGKVEIESGSLRGMGLRALALQRDGKIVVAGHKNVQGGSHFTIARFTSRGAIDRSFGNDGRVTTVHGYSSAVAIQSDGKIVAAGQVEVAGSGSQLGLARYLPSGLPDPSFGTDGTVLTDFALESFSSPEIVIQPDGRIIVACSLDGPRRFGLGRYALDGTLDPTFGEGGKVRTRFRAGSAARAVALQRDGKIVAAGSAGGDFAVARYTPGGTLDQSFGGGGRVTTPLGPEWRRRGGH